MQNYMVSARISTNMYIDLLSNRMKSITLCYPTLMLWHTIFDINCQLKIKGYFYSLLSEQRYNISCIFGQCISQSKIFHLFSIIMHA